MPGTPASPLNHWSKIENTYWISVSVIVCRLACEALYIYILKTLKNILSIRLLPNPSLDPGSIRQAKKHKSGHPKPWHTLQLTHHSWLWVLDLLWSVPHSMLQVTQETQAIYHKEGMEKPFLGPRLRKHPWSFHALRPSEGSECKFSFKQPTRRC